MRAAILGPGAREPRLPVLHPFRADARLNIGPMKKAALRLG